MAARTPRKVSAKTKGEVLVKLRKAEEDARAGRIGDAAKITVGQYLDHWLNNASKPTIEPGTWNAYRSVVENHLKKRIGGLRLVQMRPLHVETLFAELQRDGVSGGNARKISEVLSSALEHAVRTEMLPSNPAASVAKPKSAPEEIVPFTPDEILQIRLAIMGHRLEALFALAISTGARQGSCSDSRWEHVDIDNGVINIQRTLDQTGGSFRLKKPKSERGQRLIDIPRFTVDALAEHKRLMFKEGNLSAPVVFCTRTGHFMSNSSFIRQVHTPLLARAKVTYRKFHTFRHTHVSELLARGESVVDVAQRIGDRPEVILKTYAKFLPGAGVENRQPVG